MSKFWCEFCLDNLVSNCKQTQLCRYTDLNRIRYQRKTITSVILNFRNEIEKSYFFCKQYPVTFSPRTLPLKGHFVRFIKESRHLLCFPSAHIVWMSQLSVENNHTDCCPRRRHTVHGEYREKFESPRRRAQIWSYYPSKEKALIRTDFSRPIKPGRADSRCDETVYETWSRLGWDNRVRLSVYVREWQTALWDGEDLGRMHRLSGLLTPML